MIDEDTKKLLTIAILQDANQMQLKNAIDVANASQTSFIFSLNQAVIEIDKSKYELPNEAFDLSHAIDDLVKKKANIKRLLPNNLVFVTSLPFSDQNLVDEFHGKPLLDELSQCYFYELYKYPQGNVALISTFIWEHLPQSIYFKFPVSPTGRRANEPYLLFEFATIALDPLADLAFHEVSRGCPFDYCNDVHEIDKAFQIKKICAEHKDFLQAKVENGYLTNEQFNSVIKLFNRAFGKFETRKVVPHSESKEQKLSGYHFSGITNSPIIINSPSATASVIVSGTETVINQLKGIIQEAQFKDEKDKQQSLDLLSSILDEVQKNEPRKPSIQSMITTLSSLITLATSINQIAPSLLEMIKKFWQ